MSDLWLERAACVGKDPRWWDFDFPHEWSKGATVCAACPVRLDCFKANRGNTSAIGLYAGIVLNRGEPLNISTHSDRKPWRPDLDPGRRGGDSGCSDPGGPPSNQPTLF